MIKGLFALAFITPILNQDFHCKNQVSAAIMKLLMKFSRIIHDDPDPNCAKNTWCRCPHLRKARGLTLSQMAESMGKSVGWLSQVERDLSTPTAEDIAELAKTLDVSEAIFGLKETIPEIEQGISCVQMRDAIFQNVKQV